MAVMRYIVTDVEQSIAFYDRLGFSVEDRYGPASQRSTSSRRTIAIAGP